MYKQSFILDIYISAQHIVLLYLKMILVQIKQVILRMAFCMWNKSPLVFIFNRFISH